jgi:hypothetical protein
MRLALVPAIAAGLTALAVIPAHATTDEDQVRAVLDGMNTSYNDSDFTRFASHVCGAMRAAHGFKAGWYQSRESDGPTNITVISVHIAGNPPTQAVANVRFEAANRSDPKILEVDFVRERAEWKACRYGASLTT